ncbi:MAG: hypothetical protein MR691_08095 [Clostridium sp.]|nr:hypothetical protein [Clostridium sp.]
MIVLSQDKNKAINLNNVLAIWIDKDVLDKTESFFTIEVETDGSNIELGRYNQEKRAKEVLKEIINKYKTTLYNSKTNETVVNVPKVYEMPKE